MLLFLIGSTFAPEIAIAQTDVLAVLTATDEPASTPPASTPAASTGLHHPFEAAKPGSPAAVGFVRWVDLSVANPAQPQYGFSAFHAALAYKLTHKVRYADSAAALMAPVPALAKAGVAAGQAPPMAGDSYLHVGQHLKDITFTLAWCGDRFSEQQTADLHEICEQSIANVWNPQPETATWYGKTIGWSGWSQNNPGNNYHYSFLTATACWAIYSGNQKWLDYLRKDRFPKLVDYMQSLPGGGSREGTGYGASHRGLFELYAIWRDSTGEDLSAKTSHCRDSLDYWTHAICPGGKYFAPIGDQARVSNAPMFDYHRALLLEGIALNASSDEALHARWSLRAYPRMMQGFNLADDLLANSGKATPPTSLSYNAGGAGHYFARSAWQSNATFLAFICGALTQDHTGQIMGSFDLWSAGGWQAVTNNVRSHSGINQAPEWHNVVRFTDASGKTVPQKYAPVGTVTVTDDGQAWRAVAQIGPIYKTPGLAWTRSAVFERPSLLSISDDCTLPAGTTAVWQLNVGSRPTLEGNVITIDKLRVTVRKPEKPMMTVHNWKDLSSDATDGGWRLEIAGGSQFDVVLECLPTANRRRVDKTATTNQ